MTRFLLVVPPLTGHVTPLAAVARQLAADGHAVLWCGEPAMIWSLAGAGSAVRTCPDRPLRITRRGEDLRGYAAVRFLWEDFLVPLADACVDTVVETAERFRADLVVSDMQALAGPLAAARLGLPWATSATTSAPLRESFTATPRVRTWLDGLFADLIDRHCAGAARRLTPRQLELSPDLVIAFTTQALVTGGAASAAGSAAAAGASQIRYVGPALVDRPSSGTPFPWHQLDGRPLVVVTLGTVNAPVSGRFLAACAEALRALSGQVQAVIADPAGVLGGGAPPDVIVRPYLPMLELYDRAAAVVCHGGHNTVCESLASGVPLVMAPIRDDQPVVAAQVAEVGAGVRLRFGRATSEIIRDAVLTVLDQPQYGAAARKIGESFAVAGSAREAAGHLLALAAGRA